MIKAGIVGATGYTGVELLRLLVPRPDVELLVVDEGVAVLDDVRVVQHRQHLRARRAASSATASRWPNRPPLSGRRQAGGA